MQFASNTVHSAHKSWPRPRSAGTLLALILAIGIALMATCGPPSSTAYADPDSSASVCFTYAQADSLLTLIDAQAHRITMLEIDLWEARQLARADSLWAQDMQAHYRGLLNQQPNWLERAVQHPIIWFTLGGYLGIRASEARN